MSKHVKYLSLLIIIILSVLLFSCSRDSGLTGHRILGVWEHNGSVIEFCDNGKLINGSEKYTFSVTDEKIIIDNNGEAMELEYYFNSNGTMTMNGLIYYPVSTKKESFADTTSRSGIDLNKN